MKRLTILTAFCSFALCSTLAAKGLPITKHDRVSIEKVEYPFQATDVKFTLQPGITLTVNSVDRFQETIVDVQPETELKVMPVVNEKNLLRSISNRNKLHIDPGRRIK